MLTDGSTYCSQISTLAGHKRPTGDFGRRHTAHSSFRGLDMEGHVRRVSFLPTTQDAPEFRSLAFWHARLSANDIRLIYEADYFHLTATLGTGQRINLPYLPDALPPLGRGDLLRPVF